MKKQLKSSRIHDQLMAYISHGIHLMCFCHILACSKDLKVQSLIKAYQPNNKSFKEFMRMAKHQEFEDILGTNQYMLEYIDKIEWALNHFKNALKKKNRKKRVEKISGILRIVDCFTNELSNTSKKVGAQI